jgi:hypothetical protein
MKQNLFMGENANDTPGNLGYLRFKQPSTLLSKRGNSMGFVLESVNQYFI